MSVHNNMLIDGSLDPDRVQAIFGAIIASVDGLATKTATVWSAAEISEALLCDLCSIMQNAPDEATRFALADRAFEFIMRNCGIEPMRFLMLRALDREARRPTDNIGETKGTA